MEPRMTVRARASSNYPTDWLTKIGGGSSLTTQNHKTKIWLWAPKPRITLLAKASSELPDQTKMGKLTRAKLLSTEAIGWISVIKGCNQAASMMGYSRVEILGKCCSYLKIKNNNKNVLIFCC
jgi:hypothetical protein